MTAALALEPPDLGPEVRLVLSALSRYTAFPWPTMLAACERLRLDACALQVEDLRRLVQPLALHVALFSGVDDAFALKRELLLLLGV